MDKLFELTHEEEAFISETIVKELFFSSHSEEETSLVTMVRNLITDELHKLKGEEIASSDYTADIKMAQRILDKLGSGDSGSLVIGEDYVTISDAAGEIVHWVDDEWTEDPTVAITIATAINMFHQQGAGAIRKLVGKEVLQND
jgi:hypothetical protein